MGTSHRLLCVHINAVVIGGIRAELLTDFLFNHFELDFILVDFFSFDHFALGFI